MILAIILARSGSENGKPRVPACILAYSGSENSKPRVLMYILVYSGSKNSKAWILAITLVHKRIRAQELECIDSESYPELVYIGNSNKITQFPVPHPPFTVHSTGASSNRCQYILCRKMN